MARISTLRLAGGRLLSVIVAGALALLVTAAAGQPSGSTLDSQDTRFHSGVEVVRLSVTARDDSGGLIHDLTREEFEVYEDGQRQEIGPVGHHETPISVVVLIDKSGSMFGERLMHAKDGVIAFVRALKKADEALMIAFSDSVDALGGFGINARTIERAVEGIEAGGGTRLYDAVIEGARAIAGPDRKEKRALLLLSDGADTASVAKLDEAIEAVRRAAVPVYAIAVEYGEESRPARPGDALWRQLRGPGEVTPIRRLTDGTGGWTYSIEAAKRCKEICVRVADELRNQYLLGYYPLNADRDGRWRSIEVRTTRPGVTLTTRNGYFAPRS